MAAALIPALGQYLIFNVLLQIFDGVLTYQVVSVGVPEANPLVRDAMAHWGLVWGLLYWKILACALLWLIFALRHILRDLAIKALTVTAAVYGPVVIISLYGLVAEFVR